ncbi:hypothetical protein TNCV_1432651 [Trichonephila clavipes]|nr:hypothetical protein TNCV_1432651 [Trichonephila clavipes]
MRYRMSYNRKYSKQFDFHDNACRVVQNTDLEFYYTSILHHLKGYTPEIMDEILTTARDLELKVNKDDIEELIMGHEDELTIEELQEILNAEHQET